MTNNDFFAGGHRQLFGDGSSLAQAWRRTAEDAARHVPRARQAWWCGIVAATVAAAGLALAAIDARVPAAGATRITKDR